MDTSALTSDSVVPAEQQQSSDVDVKLAENGEIMPQSIYGSVEPEASTDTDCCMKHNTPFSASVVTCENNPVKSVEGMLITDSHDMDRTDGHVTVTDGDNDDDGEVTDSRSQTPLQDEPEPGLDELNEKQVAATSDRMLVNPSRDSAVESLAEFTEIPSTAVQSSREENGEVSEDDDESVVGNDVNPDTEVHQQLTADDREPAEKEKPVESRKVLCVMSL